MILDAAAADDISIQFVYKLAERIAERNRPLTDTVFIKDILIDFTTAKAPPLLDLSTRSRFRNVQSADE